MGRIRNPFRRPWRFSDDNISSTGGPFASGAARRAVHSRFMSCAVSGSKASCLCIWPQARALPTQNRFSHETGYGLNTDHISDDNAN